VPSQAVEARLKFAELRLSQMSGYDPLKRGQRALSLTQIQL
jgi:hypothetical protein